VSKNPFEKLRVWFLTPDPKNVGTGNVDVNSTHV